MPRNLGLALARVLGARTDADSIRAVFALGRVGDDTVRSELNKLIFAHMASIGAAFLGVGLLVVGILLS